MIPISLSIEGIYSYEKETIINFNDLASEGLFGIFGKVGSGKSALVEAISIALYGRTDRYSVNGMAANLLNLNSEAGKIIFTFKNFKGLKFQTITRLIPRKGNRSEVRRDFKVLAWENEAWVNCHLTMEEIIGLNYANFKRTILIPQGQFREFIELKPADKNLMMQELFNLERFDLSNNTNKLLAQTREKKQFSMGVLSQLKPYLEIDIKTKKEEIISLQQTHAVLQQSHETYLTELKTLESTHHSWKKWKEAIEKLQSLNKQKEFMISIQQKIKIHEVYQFYIQPVFLPWQETHLQLEKKNFSLKEHQEKHFYLTQQLNHLSEEADQLKNLQVGWELYKNQITEYTYLIEVHKILQDLEAIKKNTADLIAENEALDAQLSKKQKLLQEIHTQEQELKKDLTNPEIFMNVERNFAQLHHYERKLEEQKKLQQQVYQESDSLKNFFLDNDLTLEHFAHTLKVKLEALQIKEQALSEELKQLEVQKELTHLSQHLNEGIACPLCGALEHPTPLQHDSNSIAFKINNLSSELKTNKELQNFKLQLQSEAQINSKHLNKHLSTLKEIDIDLSHIENTIKTFKENSTLWNGFSPNDYEAFEQAYQKAINVQKKLETNRKAHQEHFQKIQDLEKQKQENLNILNPLKEDALKLEGRIQNSKEYITHLPIEWSQKPISILTEEQNQIKTKLAQEEKYWKKNQEALQEIKKLIFGIEEVIKKEENEQHELKEKSKTLKRQLEELIRQHQLDNIERLQQIAQENFPLETKRKELNEYQSEYSKWKFQSEQFDKKVQQFNIQELNQTQTQVQLSEEQMQKISQQISIAQEQIKEIEAKQSQYHEEQTTFQKIEQRENNLLILSDLFKGKKFVEFASGYWLKRLVHHSNQFFEPLTHHQLSLKLNEQLDFEIIDFLNGGQSRALRTLSGGQSFQVSLSLALALAEGIQANFNAEEQFFFIDEGFGTLDDEAIQHVYDTLSQLVSTKRKIGVISHVTTLQEQIPKHLSIIKKDQGGSIII